MSRKSIYAFTGFLLIVIAGSVVLARVQYKLALGKPGVKLAPVALYDEDKNRVAEESVALPAELPGCISQPLPITRAELDVLPPDTVYGRRYYKMDSGFQGMMHVVLMGADRTSIHKPQYCLTGQGYYIQSSEAVKIPIEKPVPYELEVMKLTATTSYKPPGGQMRERRAIYLYWFVADGQLTAHHGERMWWMARDLVTKGVLQRWAYVGLMSYCEPGKEDALYEEMKAFIAKTVPEFQLTHPAPAHATLALPFSSEFASIASTPEH